MTDPVVDTPLVEQMESKFSTDISGQLLAEHHNQQTRDIRKLATILGPLSKDYETLLGILNDILSQGEGLEYDIQLSIAGNLIMPNNVVAVLVIPRKVKLKAGLVTSFARCRTRPSGEVRLTLNLNDSYIGEVKFNELTENGSFKLDLDYELNPGDVLSIKTFTTTDSRIKDVAITIVGCASLLRCEQPQEEE